MEEAESDGSAEEFAHAVQERLAEELGVFASNAGRKHVETWLAGAVAVVGGLRVTHRHGSLSLSPPLSPRFPSPAKALHSTVCTSRAHHLRC